MSGLADFGVMLCLALAHGKDGGHPLSAESRFFCTHARTRSLCLSVSLSECAFQFTLTSLRVAL